MKTEINSGLFEQWNPNAFYVNQAEIKIAILCGNNFNFAFLVWKNEPNKVIKAC